MPQQLHLNQYASSIIFQLNNSLVIVAVWPTKNVFNKLFTTGLLNKKITSLINNQHIALFKEQVKQVSSSKNKNKQTIEYLLKVNSSRRLWHSIQLKKIKEGFIVIANNIHTVKQNEILLQQKINDQVFLNNSLRAGKTLNENTIENMQLFKDFLDNTPVPFASCTLDYKLTFVNKKFEEVYGYQLKEIENYTDWFSKFKFAQPDGEAQHDKEFYNYLKLSKALPDAPMQVLERQLYAKNGELKDVKISFKIVNDQVFGVINDVTEQLKFENQLKESERRFKALINNIAIPVGSYDINTMECTFINKPFTKVLGYQLHEVQRFEHWYDNLAYDDKKIKHKHSLLWQKAVDERRNRFTKEVALFERPIKCKDGNIKLMEVTFTVNDNLVYAILKDITEQRKAEILLKESEQRFKLLAENMPIAIASHDLQQNVIFLNTFFTTILGYSHKDLRTLHDWYLLTQPDPVLRKQLHNHWLETIEKHRKGLLTKQSSIEATLKCKDGSFRIFNFLFSIVQDIVYIILVDITEKKNAEKDLLQSHTQLRELASHLQKIREEERKYIAREIHDELGQLITGLKFDISFTKKRIEKTMPDMAGRLHETMQLTDKIVRTVRRISTELRPSLLDDIGLAAAIEWECKEFAKRTGIKCSLNKQVKTIDLSVEKKSNLFRIFQECLTNVLRHSKATEVNVLLEKIGDKIKLCVEDNGKGFALKQQTKTLGLVGMKERALALNGTYNIKAQPDKGTKILVEVPI